MVSNTNMTPLPWKELSILVVICIFHDMDITMVFSFTPKMIQSFGVSQLDTGYYAGWLASSMYIGFLFCTLLWSYLGDRKGKKLSMMISTPCLALSILAFGFSRDYTWALVTRFLQGCCFGAVNVSKAYLYERLDDTNSALGIAIISSCGSIGFVLGPSIGGYFVFPVEQYPNLFSRQSLFYTFPILLPHLIVFVGLMIGIMFGIIYLPNDFVERRKTSIYEEYNELKGKKHGYKPITCSDENNDQGYYSSSMKTTYHIEEDSEIETKSPSTLNDGDEVFYSVTKKLINPLGGNSAKDHNSLFENNEHDSSNLFSKVRLIMKTKDCIISCILYGTLGFSSIASNELFSLFAATSTDYNGIGLTTSQIGTVLMIPCIALIIFQIPILTKTSNYLGAKKFFIYSAYLQALMLPFLPAIGRIKNTSMLWISLCVHTFCLRLLVSGSFLTVTQLINNSSPYNLNTIANGVGFTFTAIGRLIAPTIFGSIYAWSLRNVIGVVGNTHALGFPFNYFFSFFILGACTFVIGLFGNFVSGRADYKTKK